MDRKDFHICIKVAVCITKLYSHETSKTTYCFQHSICL